MGSEQFSIRCPQHTVPRTRGFSGGASSQIEVKTDPLHTHWREQTPPRLSFLICTMGEDWHLPVRRPFGDSLRKARRARCGPFQPTCLAPAVETRHRTVGQPGLGSGQPMSHRAHLSFQETQVSGCPRPGLQGLLPPPAGWRDTQHVISVSERSSFYQNQKQVNCN